MKDILAYVGPGTIGPTLSRVAEAWDQKRIRIMSIQLASWWARKSLMTSRHPYIWFKEPTKNWEELGEFVSMVPELSEFLYCDETGCHVRAGVTREEMKAINEYARENYNPLILS